MGEIASLICSLGHGVAAQLMSADQRTAVDPSLCSPSPPLSLSLSPSLSLSLSLSLCVWFAFACLFFAFSMSHMYLVVYLFGSRNVNNKDNHFFHCQRVTHLFAACLTSQQRVSFSGTDPLEQLNISAKCFSETDLPGQLSISATC